MARIASPWFWEERNGWYISKDGQRHFLGEHPVGAPAPRKQKGKWNAPHAIIQVFHAVMASPPEQSQPAAAIDAMSVAEVFEKFLRWCHTHRTPRTYEWYRDHIQSFVDSMNGQAVQPCTSLKPFRVSEWADAHAKWGPAYRRGAIIAIQRPFNWAEKLGYIDRSPIPGIEKPQAQRREQFVTPEEWERIREFFPACDPFRDLIEFCWETGCRPQEAKAITSKHVELANVRVVFPPEEAKGKRGWRVIHLTPVAAAILKRRMKARRQGPIFVNADGRAWTAQATACRFTRIKEVLGVKYSAYSLRHGFATRMLANKADSMTVATLMGHADTRMLARHYAHLEQRADHLRAELTRASSARN